MFALWWSEEMEPWNQILFVANDLEQSLSRGFTILRDSINLNPSLRHKYNVRMRMADMTNQPRNTVIKAIPSDYAGEAGANPGLILFDELWGCVSESSQRLYAELTPVPTRGHSIRFITTYAGFKGESTLLWNIYDELVQDANRLPETDLPVYQKGSTLVYWSHVSKMPWQTPKYYEQQRDELRSRPSDYRRLHHNEWVQKETAFVPLDLWDDCENPNLARWEPGEETPLYIAIDASWKKDCTSAIGVTRDPDTGKVQLKFHRIWEPEASELHGGKRIVDLEATVESQLMWMKGQKANVVVVAFDPHGMQTVEMHLRAAGFDMFEFSQMALRVMADGFLYDIITQGHFEYYPGCDDLKRHIQNAVKVETSRGIRIKKEKATKPVDAVVALAMAAFMAAAPEYAEEDIEIEAAVF